MTHLAALLSAVLALVQDDPLSREAIARTMRFVASDDHLGRDTPSAGLDRTADYLVERLKAAGLKGGGPDGSYFHTYEERGAVLDSGAVRVTVGGRELKPDEEVRLWSGAAGMDRKEVPVARMKLGDSRPAASGGPLFVEVDPGSPLWKEAAGRRSVLARRGRGSRIVLLVKTGVLAAGELRASMSIPEAAEAPVKLRNVVGVRKGGDRAEEYVLFSAHYDHIGHDLAAGQDFVFNGADDNGTGTTAVLHLAEAFAASKEPPRRSLLFVFFSGEEKGLLGSRAFAASPTVKLERIAVNLNFEMLGRPPEGRAGQLWVTGRNYSDFESVVEEGLKDTGVRAWAFARESQLFRHSDNYPLALKGVVAHSIAASSLHSDYHGLDDEIEKIDFDHLTKVIGALVKVGRHFADRDGRPAYNETGRRALSDE